MPEKSKEFQLEMVFAELQELAFRREHLTNRLNLLIMLTEFRQNAGLHEEVDEKEGIEEELKKLSERKRQLQQLQERLEFKHFTGGTFTTVPIDEPTTPSSMGTEIFFVEPPPYPAPQVIMDVSKLPPCSSPTRCPHCEQFVTTEVITMTGSTAWLVCLVCAFLGCIAGCCLIPFCMSNYKDIVHKCPKCRSQIHKCTKL
ncbi:U11/U12 small nuclear ribonucleoprotein 25 kDa protein isoform X1 [Electrophorus electricus]|uniref:U11/U12 small nuclear ribonucleoprotein 25 kDa protein isoform X1 n=1 Tax=Electrophorus electricus TaxID=8005 RepID=UPI0015D05FB9|nr:U11/U12 small nuclear ribonucleoprotein 25 kDa protein isoform X1 [Electrophorus electricus]